MATFTLSEAISHIKGYGEKVAKTAAEIMQEEIASSTKKHGKGALAKSVKYERRSESEWAVGPAGNGKSVGDHPYAAYVNYGRGPVHAKGKDHGGADYLRFEIDNEVFYRKRVGPAEENDFVGRTKDRLQALNIGL